MIKRAGKQFRRSLKTRDRKLAECRLTELRQQIGNLSLSEYGDAKFEEVAHRWVESARHALKESSVKRRETCIKNVSLFFKGASIRNVTPRHCERWPTERGRDTAPQTFAHELNPMKGVFNYAVRQGCGPVVGSQPRQRALEFQQFLRQVRSHYRGWRVAMLLDEDSSHTAKASRADEVPSPIV